MNVAKDRESMILAAIGFLISYLCFCWEAASTRWWGTLIERAKELEKLAGDTKQMITVYQKYTQQNPPRGVQLLAFIRPSHVIVGIYFIGMIGWALFFVHSLGVWW